MKYFRLLMNIILLVVVFLAGIFFYKSFETKQAQKIDTTLIIEKIEKVLKLVAVEGTYSELINFEKTKNFRGWNIPGFAKSALVQVNGKVAIGYDLKKIDVTVDSDTKTLNVMNIPRPEILYLETGYKYFKVDEGIFTSFKPEDFSEIDKIGKETIRDKALSDDLIKIAEQQKNELLRIVVEPYLQLGWTVHIANGESFVLPKG